MIHPFYHITAKISDIDPRHLPLFDVNFSLGEFWEFSCFSDPSFRNLCRRRSKEIRIWLHLRTPTNLSSISGILWYFWYFSVLTIGISNSFRQSLRTDLMVHQSNTSGKRPTLMSAEQRRLLALNNEKPVTNFSEIMFNKVGACFNQLQMNLTTIHGIPAMKPPAKYIEEIFQISKRLLEKDLTLKLDKMAEEAALSLISYPYKSFSEATNFITTSMLRELLQTSSGNWNTILFYDAIIFFQRVFWTSFIPT